MIALTWNETRSIRAILAAYNANPVFIDGVFQYDPTRPAQFHALDIRDGSEVTLLVYPVERGHYGDTTKTKKDCKSSR